MFSRFFILRPVLACVVSIIIALAGFMALQNMPIEQYPSLTPPVIEVKATYTGADAKTVAQVVATPIEDSINGVDDMIYMESSSSSNGNLDIKVYFKIGTNPDQATINVNNRVSQAMAKLPEQVKKLGVTVRKSGTSTLEAITTYSGDKSMGALEVYNYTTIEIMDKLKRITGVSDAQVLGGQDYSMRVWVNPDLMNKFGVTMKEIMQAISDQNAQYPTGKIGEDPVVKHSPYVFSISMQGRLKTSSEFDNIIIRVNKDGSFLRLKDVATVNVGGKFYNFQGSINGGATVVTLISLQSGANAMQTAELVAAKMKELAKNFPKGLTYGIPYDTTTFVKASIDEVVITLFEAFALVIIVMYMFLKNFRATIIPLIAVPVSLLGTFAGLYLLGFSINLLTLFALVLAIGIVVDDAIIVVENVDRIIHSDDSISIKDACIQAMEEVQSPVISIVLVLSAVFIPVSFISGFVGEIQKQFALTLAVSVAISGFVALTLTPALCSMYLRRKEAKPFWFVRMFNEGFDWVSNHVTHGVGFVLRHIPIFLVLFCLIIASIVGLFKLVPHSLVPAEDQGNLIAITNLPPASALYRTAKHVKAMTADIQRTHPVVDNALALMGYDLFSGSLKENASVSFYNLKNWDDRKISSFQLANELNKRYFLDQYAQSYFLNPPPIQGLSLTGGFEMYAQNKTGKSYAQIEADVMKLVYAARKSPILTRVRTTLDTTFPQFKLNINRDKIRAYGLNMNEVFNTVQATIGQFYLNDFSMLGKNFQVNIRAKGDFRNAQDALRLIFVKSNDGKMVPLNAVLSLKRDTGPDDVNRFNLFPAARILGDPAPGYTSGQAIAEMQRLSKETLSENDYSIAWSGAAYQEVTSSGKSTVAFTLGLIFVFLILAAQYERWMMPLAIVTAVPFGVLGSILFVYLRGLHDDVYFQTGLLLLIGLSAKNAILIVEFAMEEHLQKGKNVFDAAVSAARMRFRPIIMTSLAFTIGVLPMMFATGAGSASRHALGTGVVGGMIVASTVAIFFVPMFFYILENFNIWLDKKRGITK